MGDSEVYSAYPDARDLTGQLQFQVEQGKIWLGEQRVLLMTLPALAVFRMEVIQTLGMERSKAFFMRLGYTNGISDAELARKLRPDSSDIDMFMAGPQLHMLRGMVKSEPIKIELDRETGSFYAEMLWHDSWEVEICLSDLGMLAEPACWSLLGYACGYASSIMDQEILFRELTCRGCGQEQCRIVGKPAKEWEDHEEFRKYFKQDSMMEALYELHSQIDVLRNDLYAKDAVGDAVGKSEVFMRVCRLANKASGSNVSVLLTGETGVGKEVMARGVHINSGRANEPFVAVNCASIPPDLIEAELFGVEKGAFTGASHSRKGRFERADKGTIFLDEVVELSARAQAALLRVLQEGELERVGDDKTRKVDVRLIAATNESLEQAVKDGRFRADLFYRLNVFPLEIPALRERKQDIPLLADHFVKKHEALHGKKTLGFSSKAMNALMAYGWPGNIRELENVVERGVILADARCHIESSQLFRYIEECDEEQGSALSGDGSLASSTSSTGGQLVDQLLDVDFNLEQLENKLMTKALERADGNVTKAAKILGLSRPALDYRLKKSGIGKS